MARRYFTPDVNSWKYVNQPTKNTRLKSTNILTRKNKKMKRVKLSDDKLEDMINNSTEMFDFAVSFTKTVVRISFVLFVVVNVFIMAMTTISFFATNQLMYIDTLITESYGMLRDVIAAYIIKAGTENALRIGFSVLSDYVDKKYDIKIKPNHNEDDDYDNYDVPDDIIDNVDPSDDEDPSGDDDFMDGGIDIL